MYKEYINSQREDLIQKIIEELSQKGKIYKSILNYKRYKEEYRNQSPIVLAGSSVMQGMGLMLVLAVGKNKYIHRKSKKLVLENKDESNLKLSLEKVSKNITSIATISAIFITFIMWLRISIEIA